MRIIEIQGQTNPEAFTTQETLDLMMRSQEKGDVMPPETIQLLLRKGDITPQQASILFHIWVTYKSAFLNEKDTNPLSIYFPSF